MNNWSHLSVQLLSAILSRAEPAIFTPHNVHGLLRRGARAANQALLLQYVELMTNFAPKSNLPTDVRNPKKLTEWFDKIYRNLGRRAQSLVIPTSWPDHGVYMCKFSPSAGLKLTHKFTKQVVVVKEEFEPDTKFLIESNHSEYKASIQTEDGLWEKSLAILFSDALYESMPTPPMNKKRSASSASLPTPESGEKNMSKKPCIALTDLGKALAMKNKGSKAAVSQRSFKPKPPAKSK